MMTSRGCAVFLSVIAGLVYLRMPQTQAGFIGRVGFLFFMLAIQGLITTVHAVLTCQELVDSAPVDICVLCVLCAVAQERALYVREKSNKLYSTSAYFLARTAVDVPWQIILPFVFGSVGYEMAGLRERG
jgi:hypothetical protein